MNNTTSDNPITSPTLDAKIRQFPAHKQDLIRMFLGSLVASGEVDRIETVHLGAANEWASRICDEELSLFDSAAADLAMEEYRRGECRLLGSGT